MEKKLFNYNIISKIGDGGMSSVYLGEDPRTKQKVAIKELLPHLAHSEDLRNRFRREAQIMATLDHPNIVKLLRYEETETSFFLIMEFLEGMDLEQHINNVTGPISEPKAIEIMSSLLDAFGYAHEKGIVHRDIKPANIIVTPEGKVKVLDFGIAKIVDDKTVGRTKTGTRIGTVVYMSPEQVRASNDIDLRTDIYSLGALLHQMVTGKAPYDTSSESDFDIQNSIVRDQLPRAKTIYPYVSEHIQHVIDKATEKSKENRFKNCDEFMLRLSNEIEPITETQLQISDYLKKSSQFVTAKYFLALFIIIVLVLYFFNYQSEKPIVTSALVDSTVVVVDTVLTPINDSIYIDTVDAEKISEDKVKERKRDKVTIQPEVDEKQYDNSATSYQSHTSNTNTSMNNQSTIKVKQTKVIHHFTSSPSGAYFMLNGDVFGITPFESNKLENGTYNIEIRCKGYERIFKSLIINNESSRNYYFDLSQEYSNAISSTVSNNQSQSAPNDLKKVKFSTSPSGAFLLIDGSFINTTPCTVEKLEKGVHNVELRRVNYDAQKRVITVDSKDVQSFHFAL